MTNEDRIELFNQLVEEVKLDSSFINYVHTKITHNSTGVILLDTKEPLQWYITLQLWPDATLLYYVAGCSVVNYGNCIALKI